jgi:uncharacterized protein YjiS (DUF1127 family)
MTKSTIKRFSRLIVRWREFRDDMRQLEYLGGRMLADLGIMRSQIHDVAMCGRERCENRIGSGPSNGE